MKKLVLITVCAILIFTASTVWANAERDLVNERFQKYLDLLKAGQSDQASGLWLPDYIYNVYKFGITYTNAPFKFDCASPLMENLEAYQDGKVELKYSIVPYSYGVYKMIVTINNPTSSAEPIRAEYYMMRAEDANFYLVPNYWPLLASMKTYEGKYFRLYYFKDKQVNDSALADTDARIEKMAERLGISEENLERLAADKINYFLCENVNQVTEYSGRKVPGWHDPSSDFVISNYLPHSRVLADFLIIYKFRELPLHTIPFMQKGLGVALGGMGGARLNVFSQMVGFSLKSDYLKLEDILSNEDFDTKTGGPDFAFTLSGYFLNYLINKYGMDKTLALYNDFSGDAEFVDTLSMAGCKAIFEKGVGKKWAEIEKDFSNDYGREATSDIAFISGDPGGKTLFQSGTSKYAVELYNDGDDLVVDARSFDETTPVKAALVFNSPSSKTMPGYFSTLYEKHFPDGEYSGEFYSIIFGPDEIGTYDYLTNEITSKYIVSLSESPDDLNPAHMIFKFKKDLIPADFTKLKIDLVEMP